MDEVAEKYADATEVTVEDVFARWDGNPDHIAEDLFQARNPDTGDMESISVFEYQKQFLYAYFFGDNTILNVYKGRRIGMSYVACMAIIIDGLMHQRMTFPVIATKEKQAQDRIADIDTLLKSSPLDYDEVVEKSNQGYIRLFNGSEYIAYTANPDNARGISARTVFVDEMAFIENQEEMMEAFLPTISLGQNGQMLQVSTPKLSNDVFMETNRRGTEGADDVIAIQQPTFHDADEIDIEIPLTEQDARVVRPDMNASAFETQRRSDPQGFAQEYLCRPISDEYRFFSAESIEVAMATGDNEEVYGPSAKPQYGGQMVAGVDFGMTDDYTEVVVFEHIGEKRYLRYWETVDNRKLSESGFTPADRANPNQVAGRLKQLKAQLGIDHFVMDATSFGKTFQSIINESIGRGVIPFDFNDRAMVKQMMGDLNYGLRNELVTLTGDPRLFDHLASIVKEQREDHQKPKFSGKAYSKDGKDDIAMAIMLGAYPHMLDTGRSTTLHEKERDWSVSEEEAAVSKPVQRHTNERDGPGAAIQPPSHGKRSLNRTRRGGRTYTPRHSRR